MKVRVPVIIKDPITTRYLDMEPTESFIIKHEDFFLDGPVTRRVAILDFDTATGQLLPGAKFRPPKKGNVYGEYTIADKSNIHANDFNQVSVLGTVLRTMYMFEEEDTLGRPLRWAFNSPQLLVVPRAGEWANAFYERESHSLQFFYFSPDPKKKNTIFTSLSHDIVSHETGHAVLDGVAPDLYNAISPQALALHEAVADLTALIMAFRCRKLTGTVLKSTEGSIHNSSVFSGIAEEYGSETDPNGRRIFLRNLLNEKTLDSEDRGVDEYGVPNLIRRDEPHYLSEVLSGALYKVMIKIYDSVIKSLVEETDKMPSSVSAKALFIAAERFKRMVFRALDYLPPGEISFPDYARAIIASDQASHPDDKQERDWICEEFIRRRLVPGAKALELETNFEYKPLNDVSLETLVESDWAAYEFVNKHRKFFGVPKAIHFRVQPRLDTTKLYFTKGGELQIRECLFKVSWDYKEPNRLGRFYPANRQITVGTTVAIDWKTRRVRALLTSDPQANRKRQKAEREQQQADRELFLNRLAEDGVLRFGSDAVGPDGHLLRSAVKAETIDGLMRVRGAARMLHISLRQNHG